MRYAIILILIKDSITDEEHRLDAFERPSGVGFAIDLKQDLIHVLNVKIATFIQDAFIDKQGKRFPELGNLIIFTTVHVLHLHQRTTIAIDCCIIERQIEIILQGFEGSYYNRPVT